jgi:FkbM family methyltransferase
MIFSNTLHKTRRALGFDYSRYSPEHHPLARHRKQLQSFGIDLVLDVGANRGQTGTNLRAAGYKGEIISFEPSRDTFDILAKTARRDRAWHIHNYALGSANASGTLNISSNSVSSSLLDILPAHLTFAPGAKYIAQQPVEMHTLDSLYDSLCARAHSIYLKIDTQGFEMQVLTGAANSLPHISTIQLEMSLVPLYRNEPLFQDLYSYLTVRGYQLVSVDPAFTDNRTGRQLQIDGVFHRYSSDEEYQNGD